MRLYVMSDTAKFPWAVSNDLQIEEARHEY
jgi:hypothetical protein